MGKSVKNVQQGSLCVSTKLRAFEILITPQCKMRIQSTCIEDKGTKAFKCNYLRAQEKVVWMHFPYLNKPLWVSYAP
jgi:hypothetical protein